MTIAKVFIYRIKHDQNLDFIDLRTLKKQAVTKNGVNNATLAAYFNAQWEQRKSIDFECSEEYSQSIKKYEDIVGKIQYVLSKHKIDLCFCPGGLYGSSFLWRKMCEENGVRFSSFENEQITIISPNGAASHRGDIVAKFQNYHSLESSEKLSFFENAEKIAFNDIYKRNILKTKDIEIASILKTTNIDIKRLQTEYKTSEQEIDEFKNIFWASRDLSNQ